MISNCCLLQIILGTLKVNTLDMFWAKGSEWSETNHPAQILQVDTTHYPLGIIFIVDKILTPLHREWRNQALKHQSRL